MAVWLNLDFLLMGSSASVPALHALSCWRRCHVGAARRVIEGAVRDESAQHLLADRVIDSPQPGRLCGREREARHLSILGPHPDGE